jgi:hypothetical protein
MSMTAPSQSPLFDSLAARLGASGDRPTTPFAAAAGTRSTTPASVSPSTPTDRREVRAALPSVADLVSDPIPAHELTATERDVIASMGGTVARLLLEMMNDGRPRR